MNIKVDHISGPRTSFNHGYWDGLSESAWGTVRTLTSEPRKLPEWDYVYCEGYRVGCEHYKAGLRYDSSDPAWLAWYDVLSNEEKNEVIKAQLLHECEYSATLYPVRRKLNSAQIAECVKRANFAITGKVE